MTRAVKLLAEMLVFGFTLLAAEGYYQLVTIFESHFPFTQAV